MLEHPDCGGASESLHDRRSAGNKKAAPKGGLYQPVQRPYDGLFAERVGNSAEQ